MMPEKLNGTPPVDEEYFDERRPRCKQEKAEAFVWRKGAGSIHYYILDCR